jgi:hypothetical protein
MTPTNRIRYVAGMRVTLMASVLVISACSNMEGVDDVTQQVADPAPAFSIQSANFSGAIAGDPLTVNYCGSAPQSACLLTPYAQVHWGTPAEGSVGQSGLGFDPGPSHALTYDAVFDLGSLTHFNFPTNAGTGASDVTLDLHLLIDSSDMSGPIFDQAIHIPFAVDETPNDPAVTCAYPSATPCADKITFGTSTFNLGAATSTTIYELDIVGFVDPTTSALVDGLISDENGTRNATLRAVLRETCIDVDADTICDEVDTCIGDEVACPPDPCPCDADWKNHGEYVSCVAHYTTDLVQAGQLTHQERASIVSAAGQSSCGK